jgi:hypothetical protein
MTDERSLDRALERAARSWIEEGPTRAPDRPVEAALALIQTTNQERDLRIPWRLPNMNLIARLATVAAVVVVAGAALLMLRPGGDVGGSPPSPTPAPPTPVPSESPSVAPSASAATAGPTVFDTRTIPERFALPMKVTLPVGWTPFHEITGALGLVKTGSPPGPDNTWWGPDLLLVDDAQVHDPADVVSSEPATSSRSDFVPWPADFFEYITELPGVEVVSGPEPITIGGVTGTQIDVKTPEMHPLFWLDGDFTWLGGGKTGVDPVAERRFAIVETGGHTLLVSLYEDPSRFEERDAEVRTLLDSITFD